MAERSAVDRETMVRSHQPGPNTYRCSSVAERRLPNPCVGGSIPPTGATILFRSSALGVCTRLLSGPRLVRIQRPERDVRLAVRPPRSQRGYIGLNPIRRTIIPHVLFGKTAIDFSGTCAGPVAQWRERRATNAEARGSSPRGTAIPIRV